MRNRYERLKQTLIENGEPLEDIDLLAEVAHSLDHLNPPQIRPEHKAQMTSLLRQEMPARKTRIESFMEWYPLALLLSQIRVIQRGIWLASALVLALGVIVTISAPEPDFVYFTALAPLVAAAGVALLYDEDAMRVLELEESTLASARILLLARLTLIFTFNMLISFMFSVVLVILDTRFLLFPLVVSWFVPMSFLSALAFFLGVMIRDSLSSAVFSLILWLIHILAPEDLTQHEFLYLLSFPGLSDPEHRWFLILAAILICAASVWIIGIQERRIGYDQP